MTSSHVENGRHLRMQGAATLAATLCLSSGLPAASNDVLERSRALYGSLQSYADQGTVMTESKSPGGPAVIERHTFTTYYRAPRHFYFEFNEDKAAGGDRLAICGDNEAFHRWWSVAGFEDTYPKGQGATAFAVSATPTHWSAVQIASVLFAGAGLKSPLVNFGEAAIEGTEDIGGRRSHQLRGIARSVYAQTGRGEQARRTTVWIDTETLLVRRIFEDTPRGLIAGSVMQVTTTFDPQANPKIDDSRFVFKAPTPHD